MTLTAERVGPVVATPRRRRLGAWVVTLAATVLSSCALDLTATAGGAALVASGLLGGLGHGALWAFLAASYVAWGLGMRANVRANGDLLVATGTSTSVLSKVGYDLTRARTRGERLPRVAAATGYVGTQLALDVPYYAGAFGAAAVSETITSAGAIVFLGGANLAAALYEYGLAGVTGLVLRARAAAAPRPGTVASFDTDWVPGEYLADYYARVEADEVLTIRFLVEALRHAERGRPVLLFGVGPTLHHVFAAAPVASELHLGDYLTANLDEIRRWVDRDPGAHDWRPFVRYTLRCEGVPEPTAADVTAREQLTRARITELLRVDAGDAPPLDRRYGTVISAYCADSATADRAVWARYLRNIAGLVGPGGLFVTAALRRCTSYAVGRHDFPCADVDEGDVRAVLGGELTEESLVAPAVAGTEAHGYEGVVLARFRRPA